MNIQQIIQQYEEDSEKVKQNLCDRMQPILQEVCDRWGLDFLAGNGTYIFDCGTEFHRSRPDHVKIDPYFGGDLEFILDKLEAEVSKGLMTSVGRQALGSLLSDLKCTDIDALAIIVANEWCFDKPVSDIKIIDIVPFEWRDDMVYCGPVKRSLAERVFKAYTDDWDLGSQLLSALPKLRQEDLKQLFHTSSD